MHHTGDGAEISCVFVCCSNIALAQEVLIGNRKWHTWNWLSIVTPHTNACRCVAASSVLGPLCRCLQLYFKHISASVVIVLIKHFDTRHIPLLKYNFSLRSHPSSIPRSFFSLITFRRNSIFWVLSGFLSAFLHPRPHRYKIFLNNKLSRTNKKSFKVSLRVHYACRDSRNKTPHAQSGMRFKDPKPFTFPQQ